MAVIYLSGGMTDGRWQRGVKEALVATGLHEHTFIDPCVRNGVDPTYPDEYTAWDIAGVQQADVLFAYMEEDNPSGIGLALEVGVAVGAGGKLIIFVNECPNDPRMDIVAHAAGVTVCTLEDGIRILQSITW